MKNLLYIFLLVFGNLKAQTVAIPDYRFEQALIDLGIDSDGEINGQILTSDALNVTELNISYGTPPNYPYPADDYYEGFIYDLTGLEAFINLESLTISDTMVGDLNISTLINLKYLDCPYNMLTSIDVSNNILLEYLDITSGGGDLPPMNYFSKIDVSNNPNLHTLRAAGVNKINLNNNNNNEEMLIIIGCNYCWDYPPDYIIGHVCIEVDDTEAAQNNQYPYSEWTIYHANKTYSYTDDVEACSLSISAFEANKISIYPNPVSDILYFDGADSEIKKAIIFDISGRKVEEFTVLSGSSISISHLQKGSYILKIFSDKAVQTEKILIK